MLAADPSLNAKTDGTFWNYYTGTLNQDPVSVTLAKGGGFDALLQQTVVNG